MRATRTGVNPAVAAGTLGLAAAAALVLDVGEAAWSRADAPESLAVAAWILGWTLLAWAVVLGGLGTLQVVRALESRRRPAWPAVLVLATGAAVIAAVCWAHPWVGHGAGWG
ncbi:hypothetical protein E7744_08775 [Citricoccus sp. SGAir0253]|uniref:hypothetical protein n=1 Tax=Citricoccus sp. SGAir0253 TaxID=2567881 RepID=UPI0010CD26AD|nr:hypothetical protein [Citricoccus sp. SGAir0253]QCU78256.1 hypothetical protein E7744_08775 [Citricoccus sp. SGAir0253]